MMKFKLVHQLSLMKDLLLFILLMEACIIESSIYLFTFSEKTIMDHILHYFIYNSYKK